MTFGFGIIGFSLWMCFFMNSGIQYKDTNEKALTEI